MMAATEPSAQLLLKRGSNAGSTQTGQYHHSQPLESPCKHVQHAWEPLVLISCRPMISWFKGATASSLVKTGFGRKVKRSWYLGDLVSECSFDFMSIPTKTYDLKQNSNSKTLFYKDCSLGSVKNLFYNYFLLSYWWADIKLQALFIYI